MLALRFFQRVIAKRKFRKMKSSILAAIGFCLLPGAAFAGAPEGVWMSEDGGTKVRISTCQAKKLCGTVARLARPIDPETANRRPTILCCSDPIFVEFFDNSVAYVSRARPPMLLVVQSVLVVFQPFSKPTGNSMRHERDIENRICFLETGAAATGRT